MSKRTRTIIGAGLSGLTLSRCLKSHGIPATLYERTSSPAQHGYGITLYASTYTSLLKVLGVDERAFKRRVAVDAGSGRIAKDSGRCFRANRGKLEEWLREGLDVRWEHALKDVEWGTGSSILHFANGERVENDVVVGADGVHSAVRRGVLPDSQLTILPYVVYNGKRRIERAEFEEKIAPHLEGSNVVNGTKGDARVNVSVNDYTEDKVGVSWTYSRPSRGLGDALHKPERALSGATIIPDELYQELDALDLPQPFATIFEPQMLRKDRILHWLMRTVIVPKRELQDLARNGIVLMGDAAHAQPIVGGNGANEAILDAVSLAERLVGGEKDMGDWVDERYSQWERSENEAKANIDKMHDKTAERL
jgi:2-polyprenyl-6-methoxyphenol hydroxylase-like FAD-dependent oxidoreductase